MSIRIGEFRRRAECRTCGGGRFRVFLDYGNMPLAGGFLAEAELGRECLYPLDLAVCESCSLVQVLNVVPPDVLFRDYKYLSSVTQTLSRHFVEYADFLCRDVLRPCQSFVVEIGSNDGVLLAPLAERGVRVLGVDAARNVADVARRRGLDVIDDYFTVELARRVAAKHGQADLVTGSNVFAHVDDLGEVMRGVDALLARDGFFIVEVHYVVDLLKTLQFDTVYHEHLCYFSLHALHALFGRYDFSIVDVHRLPMHGGAIRVIARRSTVAEGKQSPGLVDAMREERGLGVNMPACYLEFGKRAAEHRDRLRDFLRRRAKEGRSLSGYGASGRATTLLNWCGLDRSLIRYMVDSSPLRAGRYVPGVHIPIVPPERFHQEPTEDCLITAWNYREEIIHKEPAFVAGGGRFIVPLPSIEVLPP